MATLHLKKPQQIAPSAPCTVKPIKGWLVPYYWDAIKGHVEEALKHANGELEAQDVYAYLMNERMFLFIAQRKTIIGASTCEVVQYARKKAIRVVTLGGEDFEHWRQPLQQALIDWAGKIGADGIEAYVRKGLVPQLEGLGYSQAYTGMWYGKIIGKPNS